MPYFYYPKQLLHEYALDEEVRKKPRTDDFRKHLEESIAETMKALHRSGKPYADVVNGVEACLGISVSSALETAWRTAARVTVKKLNTYRELPQGKKRDILRAELHRLGLSVA